MSSYTTTYVYIQPEKGVFTVGFYTPDGDWEPESDHPDKESAAKRVHWLNGGAKKDDLPMMWKEQAV